jgi:glycosyltransferase involved in cell wall biosynthesis
MAARQGKISVTLPITYAMPGSSASTLPTVSVVIPAYNYEQYVGEAIDSVLAQDYPADKLEVVVVDDGSKDRTAEVVREYEQRHPDVVRLVQQDNSGPEATVCRGMAETNGELLALLDADDSWMPGKLFAQVAFLQDRPEVGLVFSDLQPVGGDGEPLGRPLILAEMPPLTRRAAAQILWSNLAFASSILMRRSAVTPPPPEIPIADWWLTGVAAMNGEIGWVHTPLVRYRVHGGNRSSGRQGAAGGLPRPGPYQRDIRFHLGALRLLDLEYFAPLELALLWDGAENRAVGVLHNSGTHFAHITSQVETDEQRAAEFLAEADAAHDRGEPLEEAQLVLRALAWDPYRLGSRARLQAAVELAEKANPVNPLSGSRQFVVLADAEELLADDQLLETYAREMGGLSNTTLAIDATRLPQDSAGELLTALVARCGLADRSDVDLLAVVGERDVTQRYRMHATATAYYRRPVRTPEARSATAEFTPQTLPRLRAVIEQAAARPRQ